MFTPLAFADDCQVQLSTANVHAEVCDLQQPARRQVEVRITHSDGPETNVKAIFPKSAKDDEISRKLWSRLWIDSGRAQLSGDEQAALRADIFQANPAQLDPSSRAVLDFLANFVEPDRTIENYERFRPFSTYRYMPYMHYTMICDAIGKLHEATFSPAQGLTESMLTIVGEPESRCRGRCGFGCGQPFQWGNQYTQECLNHDVCRDVTGENFGPCSTAFWEAAFGYLVAPDCEMPQLSKNDPPADGLTVQPAPTVEPIPASPPVIQ